MTKYIDDIYPTYATVEEADIYLAMKYGSTWASKEENAKKQLLITATREIDKRTYAGSKSDPNQELKFPRTFMSDNVSDDILVMNTAIEVADAMATQGVGQTDSATANAIESYQVGDTKVTFKADAEITVASYDDIIEEMLSQYLSDKGMEIWL